ncbi:MAG: NlpC/P60 family protein [Micrococcales bacterium]|nr:NlpC/P60 family protein [Micrococcales bacterium]MCL2667304.1 NlpC/P60 family protein [Micrococcales bacterium]
MKTLYVFRTGPDPPIQHTRPGSPGHDVEVDVGELARPSHVRRGIAGVVAGLAALTLTATTALADPPPSDDDVRRAQEAVDDAAGSVTAMEAELALLAAQDEAAQIAVQTAGETYAQAMETSRQADADATSAAAAKKDADASVAEARTQLVQVARQLATTGQTDALTALLSADDFEDMAERTAQLEHVTGRNDQIVQEFLASQTVAQTMDQRAKDTAGAAAAAKTGAETALGQAQTAATAAQTSLEAGRQRRGELLAALATAQNTSLEVQQARQTAIDAAREAQAQADARAAAQNPRPGSSGGGSSTSAPASGGTTASSSSGGETAVAWARTQIGKPYVWAAAGPNSYDCSGLTQQAWRQAGVSLAHSSRTQYTQVKKVPIADLRVGDLVFWASNTSDPSTIYHVALWTGPGTILEAPAPGGYVRTWSLKYSNLMPYGGRP